MFTYLYAFTSGFLSKQVLFSGNDYGYFWWIPFTVGNFLLSLKHFKSHQWLFVSLISIFSLNIFLGFWASLMILPAILSRFESGNSDFELNLFTVLMILGFKIANFDIMFPVTPFIFLALFLYFSSYSKTEYYLAEQATSASGKAILWICLGVIASIIFEAIQIDLPLRKGWLILPTISMFLGFCFRGLKKNTKEFVEDSKFANLLVKICLATFFIEFAFFHNFFLFEIFCLGVFAWKVNKTKKIDFFWLSLGSVFGNIIIFELPEILCLLVTLIAGSLIVLPDLRESKKVPFYHKIIFVSLSLLLIFSLSKFEGTASYTTMTILFFLFLFSLNFARLFLVFFLLLSGLIFKYQESIGFSYKILDSFVVKTYKLMFGSCRISEKNGKKFLSYGTTLHNIEDEDGNPLAYYGSNNAIVNLIPNVNKAAVIGLGAGALAKYFKKGQTLDFYEIDPQMVEIARKHFSFLKSSEADIKIIIGEGLKNLQNNKQAYDVLIIDAFVSDKIPQHFWDASSLELYKNHLTENGLVLFHISNRYVNLAEEIKNKIGDSWEIQIIENEGRQALEYSSIWLAMRPKFITLAI